MDVSKLSATFFHTIGFEVSNDNEGYPFTEDPIWVLGCQYSLIHDRADLEEDVSSRLFFTYRRGFKAIGIGGPTSDIWWGCMLRCGQMVMAQSLIRRHLKRGWRWKAGLYDPKYHEILRLFHDSENSCYSIHKIAQEGLGLGRAVGELFSTSHIAFALRSLTVADQWSGLAVHVAMNSAVIMSEIHELFLGMSNNSFLPDGEMSTAQPSSTAATSLSSSTNKSPVVSKHVCGRSGDFVKTNNASKYDTIGEEGVRSVTMALSTWRPLLLFVQIQIGLTTADPTYFDAIKKCLTMPQSVGILGGREKRAFWFIGYTGDKLMYLDPHFTQPYVNLNKSGTTDESFHCRKPSWMDISELSASAALCFYFDAESEFNDWCWFLRENDLVGTPTSMFELLTRPPTWQTTSDSSSDLQQVQGFELI